KYHVPEWVRGADRKMTRYIPRDKLEHLIWRSGEKIPQPQPAKPVSQEKNPIEGNYILMPRADTYAKGAYALRETCNAEVNSPHPQFVLEDGSRIYRALTFKEDIEARVTDYENNKDTEERKRLFQRWNDSCTGVAYKANTTKFKIVPMCSQLMTLDKDFNGAGLAIEYDDIEGTELDRAAGKYTAHLTKDEVLANEGWRAAVENDLELLKTYRDIVFTELGRNDAMAFCVLDKPSEDQLRALFVDSLYDNSYAVGDLSLSSSGSFLLVAPSGAPAGR
ncbi:MAG: hypothetical protein AABX05_02130, partial [Nanoarchaeota archaeon]